MAYVTPSDWIIVDDEIIREIASHTANPKLRIALERVADHAADAEIEASLEELSNARAR